MPVEDDGRPFARSVMPDDDQVLPFDASARPTRAFRIRETYARDRGRIPPMPPRTDPRPPSGGPSDPYWDERFKVELAGRDELPILLYCGAPRPPDSSSVWYPPLGVWIAVRPGVVRPARKFPPAGISLTEIQV